MHRLYASTADDNWTNLEICLNIGFYIYFRNIYACNCINNISNFQVNNYLDGSDHFKSVHFQFLFSSFISNIRKLMKGKFVLRTTYTNFLLNPLIHTLTRGCLRYWVLFLILWKGMETNSAKVKDYSLQSIVPINEVLLYK